MVVIIIAGGSGTRLWPLSTPNNPKHLLKINGEDSSLLQETYKRAKLLTSDIFIVTAEHQLEAIREQLPELGQDNIIVEPAPRGTASCIVAALSHINDQFDPDEIVAYMHADHYIRDLSGFTNSFKSAKRVAEQTDEIVLVGAEPDYPSTGFGYIEKGDLLEGQGFGYTVKTFKEKPDFITAKSYFQSGNYLWNCGYFVGSFSTFIESMRKYSPELYECYEKLQATSVESYKETYLGFENIAIDYALLEKVPDLAVVPATFDWMDLGSFSDLSDAVGGDESGNSTLGHVEIDEVDNSLLQNYEDKPMVIIGLDNIVVINNEHGILVARKDLAQKVGSISKKLNS